MGKTVHGMLGVVQELCNIADRNHISIILREKAASKAVKNWQKNRVKKGLILYSLGWTPSLLHTWPEKSAEKFQFTEKWASDLTYK